MWIHVGTIKNMIGYAKKLFKKVEYANISIPTYPCGCIGRRYVLLKKKHNNFIRLYLSTFRVLIFIFCALIFIYIFFIF